MERRVPVYVCNSIPLLRREWFAEALHSTQIVGMFSPSILGHLSLSSLSLLHAAAMAPSPKLPADEEKHLEGLVAEFRRRNGAERKLLLDECARKLLSMRRILAPTPVTEEYTLLVEFFYQVRYRRCSVILCLMIVAVYRKCGTGSITASRRIRTRPLAFLPASTVLGPASVSSSS